MPVSVSVRRDRHAGRGRQAHRPAPLRRRGHGASQSDLLYNNGSFFGANDWTWREESGDWRFFYLDVPNGRLRARSSSATRRGTTLRRTPTSTRSCSGPRQHVQCSADRLRSAGRTSSTPSGERTNLTGLGRVGVQHRHGRRRGHRDGAGAARPARGRPARRQLRRRQVRRSVRDDARLCRRQPDGGRADVAGDSGAFDVTFESTVDLAGLARRGLRPQPAGDEHRTAHQDDPNDPATASVKKTFTIAHASRADVRGAPAEQRHRPVRLCATTRTGPAR